MIDTVFDDFDQRIRKRHADEVDKGLHDTQCEWRETRFYICNCSPRRRMERGYIKPPGPLIFQDPLCPRCGEETNHDGDSFVCIDCICHWPDPYDNAVFSDDMGDLTKDLAHHEAVNPQ